MLHAVCDYDPTLNIFNTSCLLGSPLCVYFNYAIYYFIIDNLNNTTSSQAEKHVISSDYYFSEFIWSPP